MEAISVEKNSFTAEGKFVPNNAPSGGFKVKIVYTDYRRKYEPKLGDEVLMEFRFMGGEIY